MPFVTSKEMLKKAQEGRYAVGAFNGDNLESVQAIIAAAEELQAPVMVQTTPSSVRYVTLGVFAGMVRALADQASVPVCLHLDHGDSYELAMDALRAGYSSVMIDGSKEVFEENAKLTASVVREAHQIGVPVEAELGKVGGKEDDLDVKDGGYTLPDEAAEFVKKTGVDSLAVAIGTAHGVYKGVPVLDVERLSEIRKAVDIPLVLHGASGLTDEAVRECVSRGICKVNFATELRQAYTAAVRKALAEDPEAFDPKTYGKRGREAVKQAVKDRILILGSAGKA